MKLALEWHYAGEACVVPILLRPVFWKDTPLERLTRMCPMLPSLDKAVTDPSWRSKDAAFEDIIKGIRKILKDVWLKKGDAYYKANRSDSALAAFEQAIELDSEFGPAYSRKGCVFHDLGRHQYICSRREELYSEVRASFDAAFDCNPYEVVQETGLSHGFGKFEANRELVEWMRHYNADPAHPVKLQFYGFDSPTDVTTDSPRQTLHVALDYLSSVDGGSEEEYRNPIEPLLGQDAAWEDPAGALDPTQSIGRSKASTALRIETEELIAELRVRRPELVAKSDESRYQEAVHSAVMARQLLHYHATLAQTSEKRQARLLGIRDAMMAENLAYIVSREQGRGNVLVFAHNNHLKRGKVQRQWGNETVSWWPVGSHLHAMFGRRYVVIGSAVGESVANGIGQPEAGTLEARFTSAPGPVRFIPTHQGQGLPAEEMAALPMRAGSKKNRSYMEPLGAQSFTDFDWFAVLDTMAYTRGGWPYLCKF